MMVSLTAEKLEAAGLGAFFRPRDVKPLGVSFRSLQSLVAAGHVEKAGDGVYRLSEAAPTELEDVARVAAAVPGGIICLISALSIHGIGTQIPHYVWIAIDRKARRPARIPGHAWIVRFSGAMLRYGVTPFLAQGVPTAITSPARTVVDCFRYRNKIGLDVAMEALSYAFHDRKVTVSEILRAAQACRIRTVISPYLEALSV